jgi:hypothetical protein
MIGKFHKGFLENVFRKSRIEERSVGRREGTPAAFIGEGGP